MVEDADNATFGVRAAAINYDIDKPTHQCIYFANLHRMVPFEE